MSLVRYNPVRDFARLQDALFSDLENTFANFSGTGGSQKAYLAIDAYSTDDEIVVTAAVPGISPDDIDVKIDNDVLSIHASTRKDVEVDEPNYLLRERFVGEYTRSLKLNTAVDADAIEANVENGILTLVLPKTEAVRPRTIAVKTKK